MRTLLIIPARLQSRRLPEKLLLPIHGKELIVWSALNVAATGLNYVVAIDDNRFIPVLDKYKIPWLITSKNHVSGTTRATEVVKKYSEYDYYAIIQGDEPLIKPEEIITFVRKGLELQCGYVQAITRFDQDESPFEPSNVKAVISRSGRLIYASRATIPFAPSLTPAEAKKTYFQISGMYLFSKFFLSNYTRLDPSPQEVLEGVEQMRTLYADLPIQTIEINGPMLSVDTHEDYERIKMNWEKYTY